MEYSFQDKLHQGLSTHGCSIDMGRVNMGYGRALLCSNSDYRFHQARIPPRRRPTMAYLFQEIRKLSTKSVGRKASRSQSKWQRSAQYWFYLSLRMVSERPFQWRARVIQSFNFREFSSWKKILSFLWVCSKVSELLLRRNVFVKWARLLTTRIKARSPPMRRTRLVALVAASASAFYQKNGVQSLGNKWIHELVVYCLLLHTALCQISWSCAVKVATASASVSFGFGILCTYLGVSIILSV